MYGKCWRNCLLGTYRAYFVSYQMMIKMKVVENSIPEMFHFGHLSISRIEMLILANNSYFWAILALFLTSREGKKQLFWPTPLRIFFRAQKYSFWEKMIKMKVFRTENPDWFPYFISHFESCVCCFCCFFFICFEKTTKSTKNS